ncbi:unnamed protein product [Rotaria sp. Silwood1]|nr:unnamed protein product [Rotaria sp. Silwood1]CAF1599748.1 unnamed protein product [Rotaria sp. Silwood1]CAF3710548.1 unnamed protein product [Rotaria sp. Silwood1]CAF3729018.1 unnamed protein product [Rotaria sp. Silwood1]CAF4908914.1 unnamed protein product [Rotaria sp. Silwood1]
MSLESKDNLEVTNNQLKQCRICLDNDNPNDIISPCLCSGSSAYVHRKCLNDWRSENAGGKSFKFCDIYQFEYGIETILTDPKTERERLLKYHFYVAHDSTVIILLVQLIILGVAFLLKAIDKKDDNIKNLFSQSIDRFTVYYLSAFILLLAIVGFIAVIIFFCATTSSTNSRSNGSRNSSQNSSININGLFTGAVAIVLICAVIGLFVGIIVSVIILRKIMKHHTSKLWLRQEAEKYIIKDFQGQRKELEKYKNPSNAITANTTHGMAGK